MNQATLHEPSYSAWTKLQYLLGIKMKLSTSSTAQGGGESFKNRKPIGEVGGLHFWPRNLLRGITVCSFSTSQLPKVVRTWGVFYNVLRFSEPTFPPSGATNRRKNTVIRDFSTFSRTCKKVLTLFLLWSSLFCSSLFYSSLLSDSSHLCFFHLSILSEVWLLNFLRWLGPF